MRSHAKASTAGSTMRRAKGLGRNRFAQSAVLAVAIVSLLAFAATPASASLQRNHEGSLGSFSGEYPQALAVDQSNGDVYVASSSSTVSRFTSSGLPKNFPATSTNTLSGFSFEAPTTAEIAVDNSGGPTDGTIYVADILHGVVKVFEADGTPLGSLNGEETPAGEFSEPCGVAVDQSNGDLYIGQYANRVWRYSPSGGAIEESDYSGGIATTINPCQVAVASGSLYAAGYEFGPALKYATSSFALGAPSVGGTLLDSSAKALATDPSNGDVYVDEGAKISVFGSSGTPKYSFGEGDIGSGSAGVAVEAGGNAYAANPSAHEVEVYGSVLEAGKRAALFSLGSFSGEYPQALAVDQSNGDVYVASSSSTVSRFTSSGLPKNFPATSTNTLSGFSFEAPTTAEIAVDNSGGPTDGTIYVADILHGVVKVFEADGTPLGSLNGEETPAGEFSEPCGVAVDQSNGDLYIGQYANRVWRYSPSGGAIEESDYSGGIATTINPCQVAVASGSLYAAGYEFGPALKYATSSFALGAPSVGGTLLDSSAKALATDPSNGDVYVDEGAKISVFGSSGTPKYSFGEGDIGSGSAGVAVEAGGNAYAANPSAHEVEVYGPFSAPPPIPTTEAASAVHHDNATLNGHLDPNGGLEITDCHFEWGTTASYGEPPLPCAEGNSFSAPADVSAQLSGLTPGATYHFRLDVSTAGGEVNGADRSFATPGLRGRRDLLSSFGPDGTPATSFGVSQPRGLAFRPATSSLFALDASGIYGFDASAPPAYSPLTGFTPLAAVAPGGNPGLSVDTTGLPSAGNLYYASEQTGLIYGFDSSGAPLGGAFPIDPATTPGAPAGSPKDICGAAVDSTGGLWVANYVSRRILHYSSSGAFLSSLDVSARFSGNGPCDLAFDSGDNLYVSGGSEFHDQPTWRFTAAGGYTAATLFDSDGGAGLAVDPATDDVLVVSKDHVREHDSAGRLLATFADNVPGAAYLGVTVDPSNGHVFVADWGNRTIHVYGTLIYPPEVSTAPAGAIANTGATLNGVVDPQGSALNDCHFEYTTQSDFLTNGFVNATSVPCDPDAASIPADLEDHPVSADISGLERNTTYEYRLVAANSEGTSNTEGASFTTTGPAEVETTGSPIRTAATAQLEGRLNPRGSATSYRFEYGDQGPCDSNPCTATASHPAGSGNLFELVSQQIENLTPNTTYHYRLVADNGNPDGPAFGADMTLATRASDAPLSHGAFPGPPDSDRAWEQVNVPDIGGNPVNSLAIADSGDRAIYRIDGGSPGSTYGGETLGESNEQLAERTANGWVRRDLFPTRAQAPGNIWEGPWGSTELTRLYGLNFDETHVGSVDIWSMTPDTPAQRIFSDPTGAGHLEGATEAWHTASDDGSRMVAGLRGTIDPDYPVPQGKEELYELSSGTPRLIGLLPGNTLPSCGVSGIYMAGNGDSANPTEHWLTPDGSHAFFNTYPGSSCGGESDLYDRDLEDSTTTLIAPQALFIRSAAGYVFFDTAASLASGDPAGTDIYRYRISDHSVECLTCSIPGGGSVITQNNVNNDFYAIAVSDDGSRIYFDSTRALLPGAAAPGIYRLDAASKDLAYVAPAKRVGGDVILPTAESANGAAISPDGSVFVFRSNNPALNALNGQQNGGTSQYYLYDDRDRSLVCASCPADGSTPRAEVPGDIHEFGYKGANGSPLDVKGDFVFPTPTALAPADQNTAPAGQEATRGTDIYEWRDGRLLLVTDGRTLSDGFAVPKFGGLSPSGRDVFFTQSAALTPDAIDSSRRLYDARIGGGFEFPTPPPPCPLEACQGTPKGAPVEPPPGSLEFSGPGNQASPPARCRKGEARRKGRCVAKHQKRRKHRAHKRHNHRANNDRRAGR